MVFVKGADTAIKKLLNPNQKYLDFISTKTSDMAKTGLRSLWYAYKIMPKTTNFDEISVNDMEKELTLLGVTGIEDRLQDYVP
jgi:magnesium-transporting ATPase (P-type)